MELTTATLVSLFHIFSVGFKHELLVTSWSPQEITEGFEFFVTLQLQVNETSSTSEYDRTAGIQMRVKIAEDLVELTNATVPFYFTLEELREGRNITIRLRALSFGHESLEFDFLSIDDLNGIVVGSKTSSFHLLLKIIRKDRVLDSMFLACISVFMFLNNINIGCVLDVEVLKKVFRKPVGPLVGLFCQFIFLPLASYGIAMALLNSASMRLGLFTLGCSPGGSMSNFWTYLFQCDVNLSVVMTFISTVTAFAMMPLWLFTLGRKLYEDSDIEIPYLNLFTTLLLFVVPVGIGILIRKYCSKWSYYNSKLVLPFTIFLLMYFMSVGIYTNLYLIRRLNWKIVTSGAVVAWGGYLFGLIASAVLCIPKEQAVAVSLETGIQNPGIAFVLLKMTLSQPSADIASIAPVAQLFITHLPLWVCYLVKIVGKCIRKDSSTTDKTIDEEKNDAMFQMNPKIENRADIV